MYVLDFVCPGFKPNQGSRQRQKASLVLEKLSQGTKEWASQLHHGPGSGGHLQTSLRPAADECFHYLVGESSSVSSNSELK